MVATKRAKAPALQFFLARADDGEDCAFFSSWPGPGDGNDVGKVEDLFTAPEHRRTGIATALIAHAVDDARRRGAGPVLIGADPDDTPKAMYAALGFAPACVLRSYTKRL
jgi:GNAT superfamily N-acetyltransferase